MPVVLGGENEDANGRGRGIRIVLDGHARLRLRGRTRVHPLLNLNPASHANPTSRSTKNTPKYALENALEAHPEAHPAKDTLESHPHPEPHPHPEHAEPHPAKEANEADAVPPNAGGKARNGSGTVLGGRGWWVGRSWSAGLAGCMWGGRSGRASR